MKPVPVFRYDESELYGMELTAAIKHIVDKMVNHYNEYIVAQLNEEQK